MRLALTVDDLPLYTDELLQTVNWKLLESPKKATTITTILQDPDGAPVELRSTDFTS